MITLNKKLTPLRLIYNKKYLGLKHKEFWNIIKKLRIDKINLIKYK